MRRRRVLAFGVALLLSLTLLLPYRRPILEGAAELWIVNDKPQNADVILLPGGQIATRPPMAARLYLEGHAPRIFVLRESPNALLHADTPGTERAEFVADYLQRAGVPSEALTFSKGRPNSTWEEATQFATWWQSLPEDQRPETALLVTDAFHGRRARWCFRKQVPAVQVFVTPVPHRYYGSYNWWKTSHGVADFRSEIAKSIAYGFGYHG